MPFISFVLVHTVREMLPGPIPGPGPEKWVPDGALTIFHILNSFKDP